jgi:hypothetical protein
MKKKEKNQTMGVEKEANKLRLSKFGVFYFWRNLNKTVKLWRKASFSLSLFKVCGGANFGNLPIVFYVCAH